MNSLLRISGMGREELTGLIDRAAGYGALVESGEAVPPVLSGLTVGSLFFEPSTRTQLSFDIAAHRLGGYTLDFRAEHSSMTKGESLKDTALTVAATGADILVVRHSEAGAPGEVEQWTGRPVINAGDGAGEHPTQALADCLTLVRHFGGIDGLSVAIVGDIAHSRVAGSLIHALPTMGASVLQVGPEALLRPGPSSEDLDAVIDGVDVVYMLRVQRERGTTTADDYVDWFQLTGARAERMRPEAVVMHPGPMNRGVEIVDEVADGARSLIVKQVSNGVFGRMAALATVGEGLR